MPILYNLYLTTGLMPKREYGRTNFYNCSFFHWLGLSTPKGKCNYCKLKPFGGKPNTFCAYSGSFKKPHARCKKTFKFGLEKSEVEWILKAHNDYRRYIIIIEIYHNYAVKFTFVLQFFGTLCFRVVSWMLNVLYFGERKANLMMLCSN